MSQSLKLKETKMKMKTHITQNTKHKCKMHRCNAKKRKRKGKRQFNTTKTINDYPKNFSNDQSDPDQIDTDMTCSCTRIPSMIAFWIATDIYE